MMILVIVMRPRARLTPHLPVNYGNSLQVSTHGRPAPRSKNRALKRGLQHTAAHCTAHHFHQLECKGQALHCKLLEAKCKADVCCPAWFHCKPRTALCCTACDNSAWIAAPNSTTCSAVRTQCKKAGDKSSFCLWSPGSSDPGVERCMLQVSNTLPITLFFNTLPITPLQ